MTITPEDLRPGDLMFGPIGGLVPGVLPVGAGQLLLTPRKDRLTWRRWWKVRHAGVIVSAGQTFTGPTVYDSTTGSYHPAVTPEMRQDSYALTYYPTGVITAPRLVQAMPGGAEEIDLRMDLHWTDRHVYIRPAYRLDESHRYEDEVVVQAARGYVGTPYGFLTYAALAAKHLIPGRGGMIERAIDRRISSRGEMICSQLVDQALTDAGFHVFDDGRLPQDVVPAELFRALLDMPGTTYVVPGMPCFAQGREWWKWR